MNQEVESSAEDSNRSRSRNQGNSPATEQDWPNCGQQEETCPKKAIRRPVQNERSTQALLQAGEEEGMVSNAPRRKDSKQSRSQFHERD